MTEQNPTPEQENPDVVEPTDALPPVTMADLPEPLQVAATRAGWSELMPVQAKTYPYIVAERDLMIQSRTGSGKTGAFVLPILTRVRPEVRACQALILVPTRELAQQVARDARLLGSEMGIDAFPIVGGVGYGPQLDAIKGGTQILAGTPGRVLDHLLRRSLRLDRLQVLVFDEADRMMSMGFYEDMQRVQDFLPKNHISSYMSSATFPGHVMSLAREFLREPGFLSLSRDHVHVTDVDHTYCHVPAMDKDRMLVRWIERENPPSALIFCNTKQRVHYVATVLKRFGFDADELSSDLSQSAREKVLRRTRQGHLRFLIATDVAARGIDLPALGYVIMYETPEDQELYIHRAGRTGRAGAGGIVVSLVDTLELATLRQIALRYEIELIEQELPEAEAIQPVISERALAILEGQLRGRDKLRVERMQRFVPMVAELAETEQGKELLAMLLDDAYHQAVHLSQRLEAAPAAEPRAPKKRTTDSRRRRSSRRRR